MSEKDWIISKEDQSITHSIDRSVAQWDAQYNTKYNCYWPRIWFWLFWLIIFYNRWNVTCGNASFCDITEAMETGPISQPPAQMAPVPALVAAPAGTDPVPMAPAAMVRYPELDNLEGSMERISSMEITQALAENPRLFEERFGSLDLQPSRDNSGNYGPLRSRV